jgi:G3E family GTPase
VVYQTPFSSTIHFKERIMRLLLITGFLGSGKTTLVTRLATEMVARGQRTAILVNEIGEIGIDNQLLRQLDFNVWEILNGCICCTLSSDLVTTLQKLDQQYNPDTVIIEPSGAADPRSILSALPYYSGRALDEIRTVTIVDPLRFSMLIEVMTPLITSQIEHADLVLISKPDLTAESVLDVCRQGILDINPRIGIISADLRAISPAILEGVTPWLK